MTVQQVCVVYVVRQAVHGAEVLLGRKLTGLGVGKVVAPGGKLEPGEAAADAAQRELREEVGPKVIIGDLQHVAVNQYRFPTRPAWDQDSHVFTARWLHGVPVSSAELAPFWADIDSVPLEQMWSDATHWLPDVLRGRSSRGFYEFDRDLSTLARHTTSLTGSQKQGSQRRTQI